RGHRGEPPQPSGRAIAFCRLTARRHLRSFPTRRSSDLLITTCLRSRTARWRISKTRFRVRHTEKRVCHCVAEAARGTGRLPPKRDRKSTRLNSSHLGNSYAVFCLKTKRAETSRRPRRGG